MNSHNTLIAQFVCEGKSSIRNSRHLSGGQEFVRSCWSYFGFSDNEIERSLGRKHRQRCALVMLRG